MKLVYNGHLQRYAKLYKEMKGHYNHDKNTFHLPRQDCEKPVKSRLYGALLGHIVASVAVTDYGNTTNERMQTSRCRSVDFNGSSNR